MTSKYRVFLRTICTMLITFSCGILALYGQKPYSLKKHVRTAAGIDSSLTLLYEFDETENIQQLKFADGRFITLHRGVNLRTNVVWFSDIYYEEGCVVTVFYMGMDRLGQIVKSCILDIDEDWVSTPGWSGIPPVMRHESIPNAEIIDLNTILIYDRETCPLIVEIHDFSHVIHYRCMDDLASRSPWMLSEEDLIKKEFMLPDGRKLPYVSVRIVKSRTYERERIGGRKID